MKCAVAGCDNEASHRGRGVSSLVRLCEECHRDWNFIVGPDDRLDDWQTANTLFLIGLDRRERAAMLEFALQVCA